MENEPEFKPLLTRPVTELPNDHGTPLQKFNLVYSGLDVVSKVTHTSTTHTSTTRTLDIDLVESGDSIKSKSSVVIETTIGNDTTLSQSFETNTDVIHTPRMFVSVLKFLYNPLKFLYNPLKFL